MSSLSLVVRFACSAQGCVSPDEATYISGQLFDFFVIYLKNFEDLQDVSFQRIQHAVQDLVLVGLERETSCSFSAPFRLDRAFAQNQSAPYCKDSIKLLV